MPFVITRGKLALTAGVIPLVIVLYAARAVHASAAPGVSAAKTSAPAQSPGAANEPERACSDNMARINDFCIDRYEAYVVELATDGGERPHSPYLPVDGLTVRAKVAAGVVPQGYISQVQAAQACQNAGKRLCSADEFGLACRGPEPSARYPYGGSSREPNWCNEGKGSAIPLVFGAAANYGPSQLNDARLNQLPSGLAKTGAHPRCVSPFGVYDLVGNLHEWGSDESDGHGRFRGGYFGDAELNGSGCAYVTRAHATGYHDYSTGFRCCSAARR
ncbi:MAG TPA: SUMF1/EgtB/PvdO family nonheme iron enzyme [Polyangiaceae bacterium]|jgi:hypothetical protein